MADRTPGAPLSSSIHTAHRNTRFQLERQPYIKNKDFSRIQSNSSFLLNKLSAGVSQHLPTCTYTHTRGSEEGLRQPAVGGNLFDLCGNIDEPSNHWRDSVKAQQSEKEEDTERDEEMERVQRKYI